MRIPKLPTLKTTMSTTTMGRLGILACASLVAIIMAALPNDRSGGPGTPDNPVVSDAPLSLRLYHPTPTAAQPTAAALPTDLVDSFVREDKGVKTSFDTRQNGTSEDVHFWLDGTHRVAAEDYYPFAADGARQMRSKATFNPAGDPGDELYTSHSVYREGSGLLERQGHLLRDGRYEQTYMMDDGDSILRDRWFDAMRNFANESVYKWNAAHTDTYAFEKVVKADFVGQYWVSFYREDGSRSATLKVSPGQLEGSMFGPDGSALVAEWGNQNGAFNQSYFRYYDQGSQTPTRQWTNLTGRMTVEVAEPNTGKVTMRQVWKERPDPNKVGGVRYLLVRSDRLDTTNDTIVRVTMSGNGSHPTEIIGTGKDGETVKELDETGTKVVKVEKHDASGTALSALLSPKNPKEELVEIDPSMLLMPQRPEVPTYDDADAPPRIYDYK